MRRARWLFALAWLAAFAAASPALAADPSEMLADPKLEARAQKIGSDLRCLVCQSESIEESNADLARDLRVIVRERLVKGDSDEEVQRYVVDRYGDFVLLKPPFKASTVVLWGGPFVLLLIAFGCAWALFRRRSTAASPAATLTPDEQRRLDLLSGDGGGP